MWVHLPLEAAVTEETVPKGALPPGPHLTAPWTVHDWYIAAPAHLAHRPCCAMSPLSGKPRYNARSRHHPWLVCPHKIIYISVVGYVCKLSDESALVCPIWRNISCAVFMNRLFISGTFWFRGNPVLKIVFIRESSGMDHIGRYETLLLELCIFVHWFGDWIGFHLERETDGNNLTSLQLEHPHHPFHLRFL